MTTAMDAPTPPEIEDEQRSAVLEPVRALLERAMVALGPTSEIIADQLRIAGVIGPQNSASECPELFWLDNAVNKICPPDWQIAIEEIEGDVVRFLARMGGLGTPWLPGWTLTTAALEQFGVEFDRGEYPDLVRGVVIR